ncbi:LapA family protein [Motilimonas pumila]|uniref:Probable lipopolysaccharide assembly protein A n=1 Tax=Motilimonas pumila TaxID=2303987 RepID=A0A418YGL7_9GAMM|nr:lipopolysaccharide assembly protein LapA domain-containing protein [Motilimonas pumila]RJG48653.1 DUF1049 domain-containing protein [Motilimonas pumila]
MKAFLIAVVVFLFFAVAVFLGLKNEALVNFNYLIAQTDIRLSTLLAIVFGIAFTLGAIISSGLYMKVKLANGRLQKKIKRQNKELDELRTLPLKD